MIHFTAIGCMRALGIFAFGAFAMLGFFGEAERRLDRHIRDITHWQHYESISSEKQQIYVGEKLWMLSVAVRPTAALVGFVDEVQCILDRPGANVFSSVAAYPMRRRQAAVIGNPSFDYDPALNKMEGRYKWNGKLPEEDATCTYIANVQVLTESGVLKDTEIRSETFRIIERPADS